MVVESVCEKKPRARMISTLRHGSAFGGWSARFSNVKKRIVDEYSTGAIVTTIHIYVLVAIMIMR